MVSRTPASRAMPLRPPDVRVERVCLSGSARDDYFAFRTAYFAEMLGWDVRNGEGVDRDALDDVSIHFGLYEGSRLCGCIRLSPPDGGAWMIDQQPFSAMIDPGLDPRHPRNVSAEVSRFGIEPRVARLRDEHGFTMGQALRRAAYQESLKLGLRYWYVVAYTSLLAALQRFDFLPLQMIGPSVSFDERSPTRVAALDLAQAYREIALRSPRFLHWNNLGLSVAQVAVLADGSGDRRAA